MKYTIKIAPVSLTGVRLIVMVDAFGRKRMFDRRWFEMMYGVMTEDELWEQGIDPDTIKAEKIDDDHISVTDPETGQTAVVKITDEMRTKVDGMKKGGTENE